MMAAVSSSSAPVVWSTNPGSTSRVIVETARALLDDEERRRADRFVYDDDRHLFIVAHALTRLALSAAAPEVRPERWRFVVNRWGRPALAPPFDATGLHFNLSHTAGLAAAIVCQQRDAGVDVEDTTRRAGGSQVAERFFAPREVLALRHAPAAQQPAVFFRFWTLKEAYIKARGRGISLGLDRFWFDLSGPAPRIAWESGFDEDADAWRFVEARPTDRHAMAVAIRDGAAPARIAFRHVGLELCDDTIRLGAPRGSTA